MIARDIVTALKEKYFEADTKNYWRKFEEEELTALIEPLVSTEDPYTIENGA